MGPNRLVYVVMAAVVACSLLVEHVEGVAAAAVASSAGVSTRLPTAVTSHSQLTTSHHRASSHVSIAPTRLAGASRLSIHSVPTIHAPSPRTHGVRAMAANSAFEPENNSFESPAGRPGDPTSLALLLTGLTVEDQVAAIKLEGLEAVKKAYVAERQHPSLGSEQQSDKIHLLEKAIKELVTEAVEKSIEGKGLDALNVELNKAKLEKMVMNEGEVEAMEVERRVLVLQVAVHKLGGLEAVKEVWEQASGKDEKDLLEQAMRELVAKAVVSAANSPEVIQAGTGLTKNAKQVAAKKLEGLPAVKKAYVAENLLLSQNEHQVDKRVEIAKKMVLLTKAIQQLVAKEVEESIEGKSELDVLNEEFKAVKAVKEKEQLKSALYQGSLSGGTPAKEKYAKAYVEFVEAKTRALVLPVAGYRLGGLEAVKEAYVAESESPFLKNELSYAPQTQDTSIRDMLEEAIKQLVAKQVGESLKGKGVGAVNEELERAKLEKMVKQQSRAEKYKPNNFLAGWSE